MMTDRITKPDHVKFRWESGGGLVYDHENYGYEDATLTSVNDTVIDVLERVEEGYPRTRLEEEFTPAVVRALLDSGFIEHEE